MNFDEKWQLVGETLQAFAAIYGPKLRSIQESMQVPDHVWVALEYEPDTVSAKKLRIRTPYANLPVMERRYQEFADSGVLIPQGDGEYYVEPKARVLVKKFILEIEKIIAEIEVLSPAELYPLEIALHKVVRAMLASTHPKPYAVRLNHNSNPSIGANSILKISQYLTDLSAWRDDAHLGAWQHHNIEGIEWESFTFIWQGERTTATAICELRGENRGYTIEDYATAITALAKRGWVENDPATPDAYRVTEQGRTIREEAETATVQNYFAPFETLKNSEQAALWESLVQLRDALREQTAVPA